MSTPKFKLWYQLYNFIYFLYYFYLFQQQQYLPIVIVVWHWLHILVQDQAYQAYPIGIPYFRSDPDTRTSWHHVRLYA